MKISASPKNENYWRKYFDAYPTVTLDGVPIGHVVEADDVEGYVRVEELDARGAPVVNAGRTGIMVKLLHGSVELIGARRPCP